MSLPSGLTIKNNLSDMNIGDCISCKYTATISGQAGVFSELGNCTATEIPLTGTATPDGLFYFIKVAKGTFIADRILQTSISWDTLNNAKYIEGRLFCKFDKTKTLFVGGITNVMSSYSSSYLPSYMFDDNETTRWLGATGSAGATRISYRFSNPQIVKSLVRKSSNLTQVPKSGTLYGSNDSTNGVDGTWFLLGDCSISMATTDYVGFNFNNYVAYQWIKFESVSNFGDSASSITELLAFDTDIINMPIYSLSGGISYVDSNGNSATTDKLLGAFPSNNEWDKYIVNSDLNGKITKGDDNVWHWNPLWCWVKETSLSSITYSNSETGANTKRIAKGYTTGKLNGLITTLSSTVSSTGGFRPVLNYIEPDIASEVIY